jgi:hypothetical protein
MPPRATRSASATQRRPVHQLAIISGEKLLDVESSDQAQYAIAQDILKSRTLAEAFGSRKSIATCDYQDKPIEIRSFRFRPGEIEGKQGNYLLLDVVDLDTGEALVHNTSATNIIALVCRAALEDALPIKVTIRPAREAKAGRKAPLTLEPYPKKGPWYTRAAGKTAA